jgi:flagellar basal-body rod modification protein FlgD
MDVTALNTPTAAATAPQAASQKTVGKDEFLRLFVTQLKYQDPLSPMDSTGFTTQLAQFSSLEQLTNLNDGMKSLLTFDADKTWFVVDGATKLAPGAIKEIR